MESAQFETLVQKTTNFLAGTFILFVFLGVLIIIGLRREVVMLLRGVFEGTLQVFEALEILKQAWQKLLDSAKKFLSFISPTIAIGLAVISYYYLMKVYKVVGQTQDVTMLTIILTVGIVSFINLFSVIGNQGGNGTTVFFSQWLENLRVYVLNSFEVMMFVFFLTIDWQNPVFLPEKLWGPIEAEVGRYNLMNRGINFGADLSFTIWLAGLAILIEVIRRLLRIIAIAASFYQSGRIYSRSNKIAQLRRALKESFEKNIDSLVKFIGFTTVVTLTFFLFPRLKLVSLIFFSLTSLLWDILIPKRLTNIEPGRDLLSNIVVNIFNL